VNRIFKYYIFTRKQIAPKHSFNHSYCCISYDRSIAPSMAYPRLKLHNSELKFLLPSWISDTKVSTSVRRSKNFAFKFPFSCSISHFFSESLNLCTQFMHTIYAHNLCTQFMHSIYEQFMHTIYPLQHPTCVKIKTVT